MRLWNDEATLFGSAATKVLATSEAAEKAAQTTLAEYREQAPWQAEM